MEQIYFMIACTEIIEINNNVSTNYIIDHRNRPQINVYVQREKNQYVNTNPSMVYVNLF